MRNGAKPLEITRKTNPKNAKNIPNLWVAKRLPGSLSKVVQHSNAGL